MTFITTFSRRTVSDTDMRRKNEIGRSETLKDLPSLPIEPLRLEERPRDRWGIPWCEREVNDGQCKDSLWKSSTVDATTKIYWLVLDRRRPVYCLRVECFRRKYATKTKENKILCKF